MAENYENRVWKNHQRVRWRLQRMPLGLQVVPDGQEISPLSVHWGRGFAQVGVGGGEFPLVDSRRQGIAQLVEVPVMRKLLP